MCSHMLSFSKWPHRRMTISRTVVVIFKHNTPHSAGFNGVWPLSSRDSCVKCWRQRTSTSELQCFSKHAVSKQKVKAGRLEGQQTVTDTDHLTLHPPDGLSRHNNITPWSTRVKLAWACHTLNVKGPHAVKSRCFCKHVAEAPQQTHLQSRFKQVQRLNRKWVTYFSHVCHPVS